MSPKTQRPAQCLIASLLILLVVPLGALLAAAEDPAALLPEDCFLYVAMNDVSASREAFKKTSAWGLYKDPEMQGFIGPAEKAIRKKVDELLQEAWKELEMEQPPESLPFPTGLAVFGLRLATKTITVPVVHRSTVQGGDIAVTEMKEIQKPDLQVLGVAEMGENMPACKEIIDLVVEKSVEKGQRHTRETVRGIEIHILTPPRRKRAEGAPENVPLPQTEPTPFCYAITGSTILVSSNPDLLKDTVARIAGVETKSLGENPVRKGILRRLDAPGDMTFFVNVPAILSFIKTSSSQESPNPQIEAAIQAVGLTNVTGLGVVVNIAPNEKQDMSVKGLLAIEGEKRGIFDLLAPTSAATTGNPLLTKGLASFMVANYEFNTFYERIRQIMIEAGGPDPDQLLQQMMGPTGGPDPETNPPVNLQKEVLGQLTGPLTLRTRITKPYTDPNASKIMISLGVQDSQILTGALSRIHNAFIAHGEEEMKREMLNTDIFLLPISAGLLSRMTGGMSPGMQGEPWAFAVPGGNLVIGPVSGVEQEIRDLRREDLEPIEADPMYRHAATALPSRAGVWFYSNQQIASEAMWVQLKEAAQTLPPSGPRGPRPGPEDFLRSSPLTNGQYGGGMPARPRITGINVVVQLLRNYCDFNALPDFETVRKYFGPSVGYVTSTDEGIYFEMTGLKAPEEKPETRESE